MVNSGHFTFRKGSGVKARRVMRVFIEPEADRVLWLHIRVLYVLVGPTPRGLRQSASTSRLYEWHDQKKGLTGAGLLMEATHIPVWALHGSIDLSPQGSPS